MALHKHGGHAGMASGDLLKATGAKKVAVKKEEEKGRWDSLPTELAYRAGGGGFSFWRRQWQSLSGGD
jgi:hypothetical protein